MTQLKKHMLGCFGIFRLTYLCEPIVPPNNFPSLDKHAMVSKALYRLKTSSIIVDFLSTGKTNILPDSSCVNVLIQLYSLAFGCIWNSWIINHYMDVFFDLVSTHPWRLLSMGDRKAGTLSFHRTVTTPCSALDWKGTLWKQKKRLLEEFQRIEPGAFSSHGAATRLWLVRGPGRSAGSCRQLLLWWHDIDCVAWV